MKKFKRIFIELSNVCNLSCSFCSPTERSSTVLSAEDFNRVLIKLEGHGNHVYLHVKGEPLLHPQFQEILKLCEQHGKMVNITTNGTLLGIHGSAILESGAVRLVNVSLQSFEGDKEGYFAYLERVLAFVKEGLQRTKILFDLRLWNFEDGSLVASEETKRTLQFIENYLELPHPIYVTDTNTKGGKLNSNVYISKGYEFEWPSLSQPVVATRGTCYGLRHQIAILSNGDVVPCCLDAEGVMVLGNILEAGADFESIVTSKKAVAISAGFEGNKLVEELCTRCSYRARYFKMPKQQVKGRRG